MVRGGSVLSIGRNKWRNDNPSSVVHNSDTNERNPNVSIHAEIDALSRVTNPRGATIYVARTNRVGKPMLSKPCAACAEALEAAGISKIVYTV